MVSFEALSLNSREPVYQQIAAHVRRAIFCGQAENGDPLPSRREIAAILEVNPNTVQKAFRLMEKEGYIATNGNAGSVIFVDKNIEANIAAEMTQDMVRAFIREAKQNGLTLPRVMTLLGALWEDD